MKTGDRDTGDAGTSRESGENVIRLPREWIGPLEELVPIGAAGQPDEPDDTDRDLPPAPDAFWSEDAGALHNAVQGPVRQPAGADQPGTLGRGPRRRARVWIGRVGVRRLAVAAVAVPLVAMAVIGTVWGSGESESPSSTGHHESAQAASIGYGLGQDASHGALRGSVSEARRPVRASARARGRARVRHGHRSASARHTSTRAVAANDTGTRPTKSAVHLSPVEPVPVAPVRPSTGSRSSSPTAGSGGETTSAPSTGTTLPSGSASSGTSASSGSTPAFGSSGALGPGSSPNS